METLVELASLRAERSTAPHPFVTFLRDGDCDEEILTYEGLSHDARRIAGALRNLVAPGSRVILLYPTGTEFLTAFFGVLHAGAIAVPLHPPNPKRPGVGVEHLERIATDCDADIVLSTTTMIEALQDVARASPVLSRLGWVASDQFDLGSEWRSPGIDGSTIAFLQYTSGSTSRPKGVVLTHGNLLANTAMMAEAIFPHHAAFRWVSWLPLYHDMGLIGGILTPFACGAETILMSPLHFMQRPVRWLRALDRYRAYVSCAPNFAYDLCARAVSEKAKDELNLSAWKVAMNGSEPVRAQTLRRFESAFARCGFASTAFYPCYGLAENSLIVTGSVPEAGPVIRVLDEAVSSVA
ncbi:MAG: hypothetical protein QOI11_1056 [Candidatus Eremiobacteraeota bacterium]|nr:hypothetical protein [Candidatus Eremiobacteraeota bacterium]